MNLSEFIASQDMNLHIKDGKYVGSIDGAEKIFVKQGEAIPEIFIPTFLLHNRNFISNLIYKNGIIVLTPEQEKKYGLKFIGPQKEELKLYKEKWTLESLTQKLNELKAKGFKEWANKEYPEIDEKASASSIIQHILRIERKKNK